MKAINGLFLLDKTFDLGERALKKLRLLFKKLTTKTSTDNGYGFGYLKSSIDGEKLETKTYQSLAKNIWDQDLQDLQFENDTNLFISKIYSYEKDQIDRIEPYIYQNIYSFVIGLDPDISLDINPSKIIAEQGFLAGLGNLRDIAPSTSDLNIISFDKEKPTEINLHRGLLPLNVVYSFDFNCILFTTNHKNIKFISKEDLLRFNRFLPIDLDPYSAYMIDSSKISFVDQEVVLGEELCCENLEQSVKFKKLLLDFSNKKLYHPNDQTSYSFCPFCGYEIKDLIEE